MTTPLNPRWNVAKDSIPASDLEPKSGQPQTQSTKFGVNLGRGEVWINTGRNCWQKDWLEVFHQIFTHLDDLGLLDMQSDVHPVALYITPVSLYELSKATAINHGYWDSDPGDDLQTASQPGYGRDAETELLPPQDELRDDASHIDYTEFASATEEHQAGVFINNNDEIMVGHELLEGMDVDEDDGN
ncbi:hypothetical protein C8J56DRAFT_881989 [Mycena floridula]|nr:hypothetical protein C8J56DRAFT_881989 [Mycena floridula]